MNDNTMRTYSFSYTDCDGKTYEKTITTPTDTWTECMNDYVRFLESIFQYNIMDSVRLKEPVWLTSIYEHYPDYLDPWTGGYFSDDEEQDKNKETTHFKWDE